MKELSKFGNLTSPIGIIDSSMYEHNNRVYPGWGYSPAISAREWKDPIKVLIYERRYDERYEPREEDR